MVMVHINGLNYETMGLSCANLKPRSHYPRVKNLVSPVCGISY